MKRTLIHCGSPLVLIGVVLLVDVSCSTRVSRYFDGEGGQDATTGEGAGSFGGGASTGQSSTSGSSSPCAVPCFSDECCTPAGECVTGDTDQACGGDGGLCADCSAIDQTCSAAGPGLGDEARACLPTCTGTHYKAAAFTEPVYFGLGALDDLCASTFGQGWHLADYESNDAIAHGGSTIAGVCDGDWCTGIEWGSVGLILSAGSCDGFTNVEGGSIEGILDFCSFTSGPCDCSNLSTCGSQSATGSRGVLCTDL